MKIEIHNYKTIPYTKYNIYRASEVEILNAIG